MRCSWLLDFSPKPVGGFAAASCVPTYKTMTFSIDSRSRRSSLMMKDDLVALLPDLRAFARFMCREREAADDLVQNTVLAALDKHDQFAPGTNLKGWLFTIMRNRFYSDLRTQRRRPASIDNDAAAPLAAVDNPEATLALKELSSALWQLSPQAREALVLVGAGGFSYEEAATLCGCSVGTLKARVSRARKQLASRMR